MAPGNEDPAPPPQDAVDASVRKSEHRVRLAKLLTRVPPDVVIPYLDGERMNAIMAETSCSIDYCALSPGEPARSPRSMDYRMNFLVSAETNEHVRVIE